MSAGIPAGLQSVFERLHDDLVMLQVRWQMYRQLFGTSECRVALLNAVAGSFFGVARVVLLDDVLGGIARITDKVTTCGKENLVIRLLLDGLDRTAHASLISQLERKLDAVEIECGPIREVRHKRIAHRDLLTTVTPQTNPLPAISRETIGKALAAISDFMNSFQQPFTGTTIVYAETITALGDGNALAHSLRRVVEHRLLEREGRVQPVGALSAEYHEDEPFHGPSDLNQNEAPPPAS